MSIERENIKPEEIIFYPELGQSREAIAFQLSQKPKFLNQRKVTYLKKIISTHIKFRQQYLKQNDYLSRQIRQKFYKVQPTNVTFSRILGISFALNFFDDNEKFSFKHIYNIMKRIIPGIRIVEDSSYFYKFPNEDLLFGYIEVEKIRGKHLSLKETMGLKRILLKEIEDSIESSCVPLFMPSNEEEIYKNIAILSKEVSSISSIPHVMISYAKQRFDTLNFNVVLVRLLPIGKSTFQSIASLIPLEIRLFINRTFITPENTVKEICVFSVEIPAKSFCRKNYSINFLKIRKYLSNVLQKYIGEFRDYNGGLIIKQCEQLEEILKNMAHKVDNFTIVEEFYLSLVPSEIQPLVTPDIALLLYHLFQKIKKKSCYNLYQLDYSQSKAALIILIKTIDEKVESLLYNIAFEEQILTAYTKLVIDKQTYFCFLQINPSDLSLLIQLKTSLANLEKNETNSATDIIRIPFQESLPPTFHPHLSMDTNSGTVCKALFEGLARIDSKGEVKLAIAEKIKVSNCQKRYSISLKKTYWSNGEPLLADHFIQAWKKAFSPGTRCLRFNFFFVIRNAKEFFEGKLPFEEVGIYSLSQENITVELEHPAPYFIKLFTDPLFSPLYEYNDQEPEIFNGPFKLQYQVKSKEIILTKNLFYWDFQNVKIKKILILLVKEFPKMVDMFYKDQLDWIGSPFSNVIKDRKLNFNYFQEKKISAPFWLHCNTLNPKLKSSKIRQALSLAINRDQLKNILPGQTISNTIIPEPLSLLKIKVEDHHENLKKARKLFITGIKEEGLDLKRFSLKLSFSESTHFQSNLVYFLKESWESAFNIRIILSDQEWNTHWNNLFNGEYEISGFCKFAMYLDISYFLEPFLPVPINLSRWKNEKFLKLIDKAKKSKRDDLRNKYLKESETILQDEMPVIPVYNRTHLYLCNQKLKNLVPTDLAYTDFKYCYFKKSL